MDCANVVVVGYGFAGRCFHAYLVDLAAGLNLYGVVTTREAAAADVACRYGARVFSRFEDALADPAVDLVVLATPNDLHAPQALQAMAAGKHVVTDKPMCLTVAEADAMLAASRSHGRLLSVFQNRRWDGDYLTVRRALQDGLLGKLVYMELFWGQYGAPRGWRGHAGHGGGKLLDLGAHLVDQALQLVDAPVETVYARVRGDVLENDVDDHAHCVIGFANGVDAHIGTSSLARLPKPRWYVIGSDGVLTKEGVDPQERAMIAGDIDAAREDPEQRARMSLSLAGQRADVVLETIPGRWRSYYENIAAVLSGQAALAVTPESVRAVMAVMEAARESANTGQAVHPAAPARP